MNPARGCYRLNLVARTVVLIWFAIDNQAMVSAADWPQWRGPDRSNVSQETDLLKQWPNQGPPLVWQAEGIGRGIASVAIADRRLFTVGYHYPGEMINRSPQRRMRLRRPGIPQGEYVMALDTDSGHLLWATRVGEAVFENHLMRWLSQRTPTVDGDRLYALTAAGDLVCLRTRDGAELWRKNYETDFGGTRSQWGYCDFPLVHGDRVVCTPGGSDATVVALHRRTGELIWKSSLPDFRGHGYAAAVICEAGLLHYVASTQGGLVGVSAEDGSLLWSFDQYASSFNAITPILRGSELICARMYRGRSVHRLGIERSGRAFNIVELLSHQPRGDALNPFQDDMLLVDGRIYTSGRSRGLACIDADTLQLLWMSSELADGRISRHRGMTGVVCADERLYVRYTDGAMTLVEPQQDGCQERGSFQIPGSQRSIGVTLPVVSGGYLFLRDDERVFCYDLRVNRAHASKEPSVLQLNLGNVVGVEDAPSDAPFQSVFVPTPHVAVEKMLELADLRPDDVCCDLGSGDGRIVIAAAKEHGCHGIGYEISPELIDVSQRAAQVAGVEQRVRFEQLDIFKVDLTDVTVVTLYLLPEQNERLLPQLGTLAPGCRIVAYQNPIPGVRPDRVVRLAAGEDGGNHTIYLWTTPLNTLTPGGSDDGDTP